MTTPREVREWLLSPVDDVQTQVLKMYQNLLRSYRKGGALAFPDQAALQTTAEMTKLPVQVVEQYLEKAKHAELRRALAEVASIAAAVDKTREVEAHYMRVFRSLQKRKKQHQDVFEEAARVTGESFQMSPEEVNRLICKGGK